MNRNIGTNPNRMLGATIRTQALREAVECAETARVLATVAARCANEGWDGSGAAEAATAFATLSQAYSALVALLPPPTLTITARRVIRPLSLRATERGRESKILDAEPISGVWRVELNARIVADAPAQAILYHDPVRTVRGEASAVFPRAAFCYVVQDDLDLDTIRAAGVEVSE